MSASTQTRALWRLAMALWAAAAAAGIATLVLRGQRPPAVPSISCSIDRTGALRWFTARAGDEASASGPSASELDRIDAVAIGIPLDAPSAAVVRVLQQCSRTLPLAVALAAPDATSAVPAFVAIPPRTPDPLELDAERVIISPGRGGMWRIETLALARDSAALEAGATLAELRGPGRPVSAAQPIEIRCGAQDFGQLRDVLVGLLKHAPEARIILSGDLTP